MVSSRVRGAHCPAAHCLLCSREYWLFNMALFQNGELKHVCSYKIHIFNIAGSLFGGEADETLVFDLQEQAELHEGSVRAQDAMDGSGHSPGVDAVVAIVLVVVIFGSLAGILVCCSRRRRSH